METDGTLTLPNLSFPVEADSVGEVLVIRRAQVELYELFKYQYKAREYKRVLVLGPAGVGKVSLVILTNY